MSDAIRLYAPIEKVDEEKRTVSGWATTEQIDKQNEVVDYNGSKEAFGSWQGNIREMHEPKAVGKAIEIIPNDSEKRIWVEAHISKGAEDTWEKVKDGTLTGFSIGGRTLNKTVQIMKDADSNESKTVTRITKYQLNELSLVDNPANPGCSFELVKSVGGTPYQTEVVEDIRKVVMTEAEDPLKSEITEHRDKADALIKKVLDSEELDGMSDDDFGVVRKFTKAGTIHKERLIPMPDKVHAVRALEILHKYSLTDDEKEAVHKKAESILGAAYDTYKNINRGGNDIVSNELATKLIDQLTKLTERVDKLAKDMEGAYKPVPGSKERPNKNKSNGSDPSLGESAPHDGEKDPADVDAETQKPEGAYPNKSNEPEKALKALVGHELGKDSSSEDIDYVMGVVDHVSKLSDEEFEGFKKSLSKEQGEELDYILNIFDSAYSKFEKAAKPDTSSLETQEEQAAPGKKDGTDSEGAAPGENASKPHPAKVSAETQKPEGAYPNKENTPEGPSKADNAEAEEMPEEEEETEEAAYKRYGKKNQKVTKNAGSEKDLGKLTKAVDSLRKKVEDMDKAMRKARPRKFKVEKAGDGDVEGNELQKRYNEILKVVKSGKELTPEQERERDEIVKQMIDTKFNKRL